MQLTFPHMGNLYIPLKALFNHLEVPLVVPPYHSKRSLSLGTKYSPESVCLPFKLILGNYLEALEQGADTLFMGEGPGLCRFGFYAEVHRKILQDLGYKFAMELIDIADNPIQKIAATLRRLSGKSWSQILSAIYLALTKLKAVDDLERMALKVRPRELVRGRTTEVHAEALARLDEAKTRQAVVKVKRTYLQVLQDIPQDPTRRPLCIGVLGEFYVVLDQFTNQEIEKRLGELGVEVTKFLYPSDWASFHLFLKALKLVPEHKDVAKAAKPYLAYNVSGDGLQTIGQTILCAREGYDAMIQLTPFSCMPEIVAQYILPRVRRDHPIPVLTLTLDEHSADTGIQTRLEAFVDMLYQKRARANPAF